jgi:hypothetical protein
MTDTLTVYIVCKDPDNFYKNYIDTNNNDSIDSSNPYGLNDYVSAGDCVDFSGDNDFSEKGNNSCSNVPSSRALSNSKGVGNCSDDDDNKYVCLSISDLEAPIFKSGTYTANPQSDLEWALTGEWKTISESADRYNMKCTYNAEMMNRQYITGYYNSQTNKFLLKTGTSSTSTQLTNSPWSNLLSAFDFYVEVDTAMQTKYLLPVSCWGPSVSQTCLNTCALIPSSRPTEQQSCLTNPKLNLENQISGLSAESFYGLSDDIRDMVACYAPKEATDSYNKQLGVEISSGNRMCAFSLCQNSNFYKTYSENVAPTTMANCPDINSNICIQDIDVDNYGQISADSITIAANCVNNINTEAEENENINDNDNDNDSTGFFSTKNIIILSSVGGVLLLIIIILLIVAFSGKKSSPSIE